MADQAYRGYMIRQTLTGVVFVERDQTIIVHDAGSQCRERDS